MDVNSKIYIPGHNGMVGSAIVRKLKSYGYKNLVFTPSAIYNLTDQKVVNNFFSKEKPEYVIDAAAKVGGILANNTFRGQFLYENIMIQSNLIHAAHENCVKKFLFLGSSCIYPKFCSQPIKEESILSGVLENTNEPYAIAKISGIKMCESYYHQYGNNFISVMPTNLFGPNDNFNLQTSHVLPALIHKIHLAKINNNKFIEVWGTGKPKREFLYVDDLADACIFIMHRLNATELYDDMKISHINIGSGKDYTISGIVSIIANIIGFNGTIKYDITKPDGTPKKLLDITRITKLGWKPNYELNKGIKASYKWFLENEIK